MEFRDQKRGAGIKPSEILKQVPVLQETSPKWKRKDLHFNQAKVLSPAIFSYQLVAFDFDQSFSNTQMRGSVPVRGPPKTLGCSKIFVLKLKTGPIASLRWGSCIGEGRTVKQRR